MSKTDPIKPVKMCSTHIGGTFGRILAEKFVENGWIIKKDPNSKDFVITDKGQKEFSKLGIDLSKIK